MSNLDSFENLLTRLFFDENNDLLIIVNNQNETVELVNKAFCSLFNLKKEEIERQKVSQLNELTGVNFYNILNSGQDIDSNEISIILIKDRYIQFKVNNLDYNNKSFSKIIGRDLTKEIRIRKELEISERNFKTLFNNGSDAFILVDEQANVVEFNDLAKEMYGLRDTDRNKITIKDLSSEKDDQLNLIEKYIEKVYYEGKHLFEWIAKKPHTKEEFYVEVSLKYVDWFGRKLILSSVRDITNKKLLEFELEKINRNYSILFENILIGLLLGEGVLEGDKLVDIKIVHLNPYFYKIFELNKENVHFKSINEFDLLKGKNFIPEIELVLKNGIPAESQYYFESLDKILKFNIYKVSENQIILLIEDITERIRVFEKLKQSEEKYRYFVEKTNEGITLMALREPIPLDLPKEEIGRLFFENSYLEECNTAFLKMYGFEKREDILGKGLAFFWGDNYEENYKNLLPWIDNDFSLDFAETKEYDKFGNLRYFLNNTIGIIKDNLLYGVWGSQLDITQQKMTEEMLKYSEEKFRTVIEQSQDGFMIIDENGRIIECNNALTAFSERKKEDVINLYIWDYLASFVQEERREITAIKYKDEILKALKTGESWFLNRSLEYSFVTSKGETKHFSQVVFPIKTNRGFRLASISRDITQQKIDEQKIKNYIKELERKNDELSKYTFTVSHDLKSPIITIRGYIEPILKDVRNGNYSRLESDLRRIGNAAEKMQNLLDGLLELSRIGKMTSEFKEFEFSDVIKEILELLDGLIKKKNIKIIVQNDFPKVYGDRLRLRQAIQNLVENSIKYMGDNPEPTIKLGCKEQHNQIVFYVEDNGMGIKKEHQKRLFNLFEKIDPSSPGIGIGLAIVKRIIDIHNGRIWIESEGDKKGTTVYFTLNES